MNSEIYISLIIVEHTMNEAFLNVSKVTRLQDRCRTSSATVEARQAFQVCQVASRGGVLPQGRWRCSAAIGTLSLHICCRPWRKSWQKKSQVATEPHRSHGSRESSPLSKHVQVMQRRTARAPLRFYSSGGSIKIKVLLQGVAKVYSTFLPWQGDPVGDEGRRIHHYSNRPHKVDAGRHTVPRILTSRKVPYSATISNILARMAQLGAIRERSSAYRKPPIHCPVTWQTSLLFLSTSSSPSAYTAQRQGEHPLSSRSYQIWAKKSF